MKPLRRRCILITGAFCCLAMATRSLFVRGEASKPVEAAANFDREIRPLLKQYCLDCHSTEKQKGELDLEVFATLDAAKRSPRVWQSVAEQLSLGEMPPKDKPQPTAEEKQRLAKWVAGTLDEVARSQAGDPGPVVLRRLSNAEFMYTIRDLTGVDSLDPAREFPADGAAGEGFTNTGQALVMSPSLVVKYLDAAKAIARHALLLPDGIRFSPKTTRRDWTEEILAEIRGFYREFTDPSAGGEKVNLQGIVFDTNQGGRLPVEKYLAALIEGRNSLADGTKRAEDLARERGLSSKYLKALSTVLAAENSMVLMDRVRASLRAGDAASIARDIAAWQKVLWKFNPVGHIGKLNGPKAWMEPVTPLAAAQELRLKLPAPGTDGLVRVYFVASDAGDGGEGDQVLWQRPRLVVKGKPDLMVHAVASGIDGGSFDADGASMRAQAPSVIEVRLPADAAAGRELAVTAELDAADGREGSAQVRVSATRLTENAGLIPAPVLVHDASAARRRFEQAFDEFRHWFPPALCYAKIVPVDEVVTLTLHHREDDQLARLMLDDQQKAKLDRMWDELRYVSHDALDLVDAFAQLMEYATQDADPKVFEPLRKPIHDRAEAFRRRLVETRPGHVDAVLDFADRAYRRPLTDGEKGELRGLYGKLIEQGLEHDEAIRLTIARVLVAPAFLYKPETPGPGVVQAPVNDWELASRLSYFLWSSMPDAELMSAAAAGRLRDPDVLAAQARRMLRDDHKVRRPATEFACQWLHIHGFDELDEKSERHFPTFGGLRDEMYEEAIRFFEDLFREDQSVLSILDADHTFLNQALAEHYGIPGVEGDHWRRVHGMKRHSRGGVLGLGATLTKQSGASRTSPILRGNWVAEVLLGDKLPRPPKDVPVLPEEESAETLTVRQLTEKHSSDPRCAGCHARIDAFGFALEGFDAIGRKRDRDLAGRAVDTRATTMDGVSFDGIDGLRQYLLTNRRDAFLRQFCRKLLGYALGRGVQLSDEPLLEEMKQRLSADGYRVGVAVEMIVRSRQFREIRGRESAAEGSSH